MGNPKGYLNIKRKPAPCRPIEERCQDYRSAFCLRTTAQNRDQAARCMDCSTPFCHWSCPLGNYIPEWNDLAYNNNWPQAYVLLNATNILPEVTGRICPAPCEYACVLGINDEPVTVRENELAIVEQAFKNGQVMARLPRKRSGKKVAVIGSGPAGLSAAVWLNRFGHEVTVFEKDDKIGGLLRYGIPDFKLEKSVLDRRIAIWKKEGLKFSTGIKIGKDLEVGKLKKEFSAIILANGSRQARDLKVSGRELRGIYLALDYLTLANRLVAGEKIGADDKINAKGKRVVVIGGGDTGADCVGTANRQGAAAVTQIEIMPKPSVARPVNQPWPTYPNILKTSSSHEEGCERRWSVVTKEFVGQAGKLTALRCAQADNQFKEIPRTEFSLEADLVFLALGFLQPEHEGLLDQLEIEYDQRGNIKTGPDYQTSKSGIFAAGDARRGQSLVVWALAEGQQAALAVESYLKKMIL